MSFKGRYLKNNHRMRGNTTLFSFKPSGFLRISVVKNSLLSSVLYLPVWAGRIYTLYQAIHIAILIAECNSSALEKWKWKVYELLQTHSISGQAAVPWTVKAFFLCLSYHGRWNSHTQMYWPVETGIASCVTSTNTFFYLICNLSPLHKWKKPSQLPNPEMVWYFSVFKDKLSQLKFSFSKIIFKILKLFCENASDYTLYCCVKIKLICVTVKLFSVTWISPNTSWL